MNLIFIGTIYILQHLPEVTGKILEIDEGADDTTLVLATDGTTLVEIVPHVATLITGNTALVTTVVVDKDVTVLVTMEGIKLDETEKTGGTTCVETGGTTVVMTHETIDSGTLGQVDEDEAVAVVLAVDEAVAVAVAVVLAVDVAVAVNVPVAKVPEIKTIKNEK